MKTIELLAPAGDVDSFVAAVQNGANAIYLGGTVFNARAFAKNFDDEQLQWAVHYGHARGVKIYVTVNTLFKDEEFDELIQYIDKLYQYQVDALIIQDIGLFHLVKTRHPDFELHMSTQAAIMNQEAVRYFEEQGADRVVLARENTLEEIRAICQTTPLEVEVFVHGALCVAYSGQCLMSSMIGKRSGNRGQCAQPCRLKYQLKKGDQLLDHKIPFLLSPKDLMTIEHVGDLIDAGVTSFKIEGRMKRPEYVASVVKAYRKAIDAHIASKSISLDEDIHHMKSMFNRDYTTGYAFHDDHVVKGDYSGNKGVIIGKVLSYSKKNKLVKIQLLDDLKQGDSIVFETIDKGRPVNKIYLNHKLVSQAHCHDVVEIEFDYPVYNGAIRKTINVDVIKELQKTYDKEYVELPISMTFIAHIGKKAKLTVRYQSIELTLTSENLIEKAQKTPLLKDRIEKQLRKTGQTPFVIHDLTIDSDDQMMMSIKELNELRRGVLEKLHESLSSHQLHLQPTFDGQNLQAIENDGQHEIYVVVRNLEQLTACLSYPVQLFYTFQDNLEQAYQLAKEHHKELGLYIDKICKDQDLERIHHHPALKSIKKVIVNDYGALHAFQDYDVICGTGMNIYNSYSASCYPYPKILSLEMSKKQIQHLHTDYNQCFVQIYGKIENMISEYCPISQYYFGYQKKGCQICKSASFSLVDRKDEEFELMMDEQCRMHLLNCRTLWIEQFDKLKVHGYFIHFTNEQSDNVQFIMDEVMKKYLHHQATKLPTTLNVTTAYFKD